MLSPESFPGFRIKRAKEKKTACTHMHGDNPENGAVVE